MNKPHPYRATILPVTDEKVRPLWSVMIPTYNCADYLRETLASVLTQAPSSEVMQIEVIDDCSTQDDPKAVVEELGHGRVSFYQQVKNVGYIGNFETCLMRARGQLVHLLHGDDCVRNGFYRKMQQLFEQHSEIGAAFCRHIIMDDNSHWKRFSPLVQAKSGVLGDWLKHIVTEPSIQTPSVVVLREVYEKLGGFDRRMASCGEDWEMWVRIAAQYPIGYEVEPLALYRDRANSITKRSVRSGQNIRDVRLATELIRDYLPETKSKELLNKALEVWAFWALFFAQQMVAEGDTAAAMIQIQEGLKCSYSRQVIEAAIPLTLAVGKQRLRQILFTLLAGFKDIGSNHNGG